jgi:hypothetical protein
MTTMLPYRHKENLVNEIKPQFHSFGARPGKLRFAQMLDTERAAGRLNGFEPVTNCSNHPAAADGQHQAILAISPMNFPLSSYVTREIKPFQTTINILKTIKTNSISINRPKELL